MAATSASGPAAAPGHATGLATGDAVDDATGHAVGGPADDPADDPAVAERRHAGLCSYLAHLRTFRGRAAAVLCLFVLANAALAVVPVVVGRFVGALAATPVDERLALRWAAALICCGIAHDLCWRAAEQLWVRLVLARGYEYEDLVLAKVIDQPYPYFVGTFTGKISSYASTLGREYREFLNALYWEYCEQIVRLPILVAIMFTVNLRTGCAFAAGLAVMFLLARLTVSRVAARERAAADTSSDLEGHVIDVIANFVAVKSFGRERAEQAGVRDRRRGLVRAAASSYRWNFLYFAVMSLVVRYLLWPATVLLNLHLYLDGDLTLTQFATFLTALMVFSDYIWATVWIVSQLNLQFARVEEAYRYLFGSRDIIRESLVEVPRQPKQPGRPRPRRPVGPEPPRPAQPPDPLADPLCGPPPTPPAGLLPGPPAGPPPGYARTLRIDGLRFAYPDAPTRPVLDGVTLSIARDEKVGIVGLSGSGKSTLLKLLLGYYPLPAGTLLLDGVPIDDRQLARLIAYVPQDVTLFHRSIRENIVYGAGVAVSGDELESAARRAHAHEFIVGTDQGYDTLVGERGIRLSTGQRQRIALARAFLCAAPILVLDEATSALDSESERLVQEALEELWATRTVIAIAHRLSTLLTMDRIVVLDRGRITEEGTHRELLARGGLYHHLWCQQSGGLIGAK